MPPETLFHVFALTSAAFFGATVGSFLNVCIYRLPRAGLRVNSPARSFCPLCGDRIAWYDNLPVLSWVALGGRCRSCRAPISLRYPCVEALTAALFVVVVERFVFEGDGSWPACIVLLVAVSALLVAALIDIDLRIIPDEITIGGMHLLPLAVLLIPELRPFADDALSTGILAGIANGSEPLRAALPAWLSGNVAVVCAIGVAALVGFGAGYRLYASYRRVRFPEGLRRFRDLSLAGLLTACALGLVVGVALRPEWSESSRGRALASALVGMLAGSGLIYAVGVVGTRVFRKPAMGFGDVKLMGALGALTGWWGALTGFFVACLLGSVFGIVRLLVSRDRYLPFGPFLTVSALFVYFWADAFRFVVEWYLALFAVV